MTFERTNDPMLVASIIRRAWNRPEMLSEGADISRIPSLGNAQCFIGWDGCAAAALFIGYQQSPVCLDLHVCMTPECRGRSAVEMSRAFLRWLPVATAYRKVIGSIPAYNKPMLFVALRAGMTILAVNRDSTMRNGKLEDQIIVERRIA